MNVSICIYIYTHIVTIYIHIYFCGNMYLQDVFISSQTYVYSCTVYKEICHMCMYARMHACMMRMRMRICTCTCACVSMQKYIYASAWHLKRGCR